MTWLNSGTTLNICDEDLAPALIHVLATDLGVDPTKFYESVQRIVAAAAKRQAAESEKDTPDTAATVPAPGTGESTPPPPDGTYRDDDEQQERGLFSGMHEEAL